MAAKVAIVRRSFTIIRGERGLGWRSVPATLAEAEKSELECAEVTGDLAPTRCPSGCSLVTEAQEMAYHIIPNIIIMSRKPSLSRCSSCLSIDSFADGLDVVGYCWGQDPTPISKPDDDMLVPWCSQSTPTKNFISPVCSLFGIFVKMRHHKS